MVYGGFVPSSYVVSLRLSRNPGQIPNVYKVVRDHIHDSYGFDLEMANG